MMEGDESACLLKTGIKNLVNELIIRYEYLEEKVASIKDPEEALRIALQELAKDEAYEFLCDFAPIAEADYNILKDVFSKKYDPEILDRLIEIGVLEKRGDTVRLPIRKLKMELRGDPAIVAEYWKRVMEKENGPKEVCEFLNAAIDAGYIDEAVDLFLQQNQASDKLIEVGEKLFETINDNKEIKDSLGEKWAEVVRHIANMCFDTGRKNEAEKYYIVAIQEFIDLAKKDEKRMKDLAKLLYNLANLYHFMRRYEDAEKNYDWSASIMRDMGMVEELSVVLDSLGLLCMNLRKTEKAKDCLEESAKIRKELARKDKTAIPDYAKTVNNLGVLYRRLKQLEKVEECYKDVIDMLRDVAGTSPELIPELATVLNNLASLYIDEGRLEDAEKLVAEIMMYDRFLPPDIKMRYYMNLAKILENKDEQAAGEYYFKSACLAFNLFKSYGYNSPNFIHLFEKAEKLAKDEISGDAAIMKSAIMRFYYRVDTAPPAGIKYSKRGELILRAAKGEAMNFVVQSEEDATAHIIARDILPKVRAKMRKYEED
ncbi:MAG: hypothetical protein DSY33_02675 [Archaeoglobus sp.]|nr:MAG: hypothetical protein DSY33_02675 [Archaeoglobus sp.]